MKNAEVCTETFYAYIDENDKISYGELRGGWRTFEGSPAELVRDLKRDNDKWELRLLGTPRHREFVRVMTATENLDKLWLGAPGPCVSGLDSRDPLIAAYSRQLNKPPSLGGWQRISSVTLSSYGLLSIPPDSFGDPNAALLLLSHPAWVVMSFIGGVFGRTAEQQRKIRDASIRTIGSILDPRWFIPANHPDSLNPLFSYLGLNKENFAHIFAGAKRSGPSLDRAKDLVACWHPGYGSNVDEYHNNHYYREFLAAGSTDIAALRMTRRFVRFIADSWLDSLCQTHRLLVVPHHLTNELDLFAWESHVRSIQEAYHHCVTAMKNS